MNGGAAGAAALPVDAVEGDLVYFHLNTVALVGHQDRHKGQILARE
jgi:hypothetical protein